MLIDEKNPLIFMHIPKTGGMSLFTAFCKFWGTRIADLYNVSSADPGPAEAAIRAQDKCLYCGHFPFGLHEWFDRPVCYASVLRQPVERVVSLYHYVQPMLSNVCFSATLAAASRKYAERSLFFSLSDFDER